MVYHAMPWYTVVCRSMVAIVQRGANRVRAETVALHTQFLQHTHTPNSPAKLDCKQWVGTPSASPKHPSPGCPRTSTRCTDQPVRWWGARMVGWGQTTAPQLPRTGSTKVPSPTGTDSTNVPSPGAHHQAPLASFWVQLDQDASFRVQLDQ